jgi:molybdopterin-containing oxidoreductase family membrane subunit
VTLLPYGVTRAASGRFLAWLVPWMALLVLGGWAAGLVLSRGLNQTNMDNRFAFGLWIFLDLTVIALGAGAFTTGFLLYVLRRRELAEIIRPAVVIGFVCYSGAVAVLLVDVGQPLRAWFTFWHPNVHSMLTEVTFCISCYLLVLALEYAPIVMRNRRLRDVPGVVAFEHEMHRLMIVLAGVGALLSFFHQGSLGGLYGVLRGRPFAFREAVAIWPSTFFLFVLSAVAVGPVFLSFVVQMTSWLTRKPLVGTEVHDFLARLSGRILVVYVGLKSIDTLVWLNRTTPAQGFHPFYFYSQPPFGSWILFAEMVPLGLLPALLLVSRRVRARTGWRVAAALLACGGIALNRYVLTIQTQSLPTLSFDPLLLYAPSWQETATFLGVVAYGVIVYSLSYRYLPLFPRERSMRGA